MDDVLRIGDGLDWLAHFQDEERMGRNMKDELKQYEVEPSGFWNGTWMLGDGYDVMEHAHNKGWGVIGGWGRDGYDLGSWPYVIVFEKKEGDTYNLVLYVEGDVTAYKVPTLELRNAIVDEIAFFYWKNHEEDWVKDYSSVDELPEELKGPCRA